MCTSGMPPRYQEGSRSAARPADWTRLTAPKHDCDREPPRSDMLEVGQPAPAVLTRSPTPARRVSLDESSRPAGGRLLLPQGRHAGLHPPGLQHPRQLGASSAGSAPTWSASARRTPQSHRKFKEKYGLPFPLLADTEHAWPRTTASGSRRRTTARPHGHRALDLRDRRRRQPGRHQAAGEAGRAHRLGAGRGREADGRGGAAERRATAARRPARARPDPGAGGPVLHDDAGRPRRRRGQGRAARRRRRQPPLGAAVRGRRERVLHAGQPQQAVDRGRPARRRPGARWCGD